MTPPRCAELLWIDKKSDRMCDLVQHWASINTGSYNLSGLAALLDEIRGVLEPLSDQLQRIPLPPQAVIDEHGDETHAPLGEALLATKRPAAERTVLLGIHVDTVFGPDHPFQTPRRTDDNTLVGPGVADAKGGLVVMLTALEAFERSDHAHRLGWQVLINPDEEIGSPGSAPLLKQHAAGHVAGLVFEPTLPEGRLIAARKGSGNYAVVVRGRSAHVGREFEQGRNAVLAAAQLAANLSALTGTRPGLTVNVGRIQGGGPVNVVPDLAVCRFNVRLKNPDDVPHVQRAIRDQVQAIDSQDGYTATLHGGINSPPKPLDPPTERLLKTIAACGQRIGLDIGWRDSGGVCDGNKLAAAGLPTVDTLGPRGGDIHSDREYLLLDSLTERAKLTTLLLTELATGGSP